MKSSAGGIRRSPAEAHAAIERFLKASGQPILLEPGEDRFALIPGSFAIDWDSVRLTVQAWDETRNLVRRVTGLKEEKPGKVDLLVEKFPKREGRLFLIDLARPAMAGAIREEKRLSFREQFRRLLSRQLPDWKLAELTSGLDQQHSLSGSYPRALLKKGQTALAAIGAPPHGAAADGALSFGLIWLEYLRRREPRLLIEGLAIFLPQGEERTTCLRLRFLDPAAAEYLAFVYSPEGYAERADLGDYGNIDTKLEPFRDPSLALSSRVLEWTERFARLPHVERVASSGAAVSLRVRGIEFARAAGDELKFGLMQRAAANESSLREVEGLARELARQRSPEAADQGNALYGMHPEGWLESQLRAHLEGVDAALVAAPVYGQVPALAGGERGVLDLVAVERTGRLAVLELKASEDVHLPLQALDYWIRVQWHVERGEFREQGYFPGMQLSKEPPRLLLIAPSLCFHPTTDVILRYFAPAIPVERIGLGVEWRKKLKVVFRVPGSQKPF